VLRSFALERTMLFVGCRDTMSDPNFEGLVAWAKGALADSTHRHFLLCPTDQLAAIREDLKAIPWLYPVGFGRIPDLVPFLRNLTPVAGPPVGTVRGRVSTARLDLTRYARAVRERYAHLKLESLDQTGSAYRELQLARVFVAQSVRESQEYLPQVLELPKEHLDRLRKTGHLEQEDLEAGALEELRRRYVEQPLRDALELVADPSPDLRRLVILGDPGAGKSALLQTQALRWADQAESARDDAELPLMIEIRSYAAARHDDQKLDLLDFIVDGRGIPCRLNREAVRARLDAGNACVLFDALDEAFDPGVRGEIVNGILRFANDFPAARIVVTSRVIGYQGEDFRGAGFRHYMIQELDDQQITSFLERWHAHTYPPSEAAERDQKQWRLSHAIADARPIRELAGNPLLLTMMAILNRYQDLPRGRAELYEQCARLLLQQWKVSDALRADPALTADALAIGLPEKQSLLRRLARQMQSGSSGALGNLISTSQLEGVIEEAVRPIVQGNPRAVARALIRQLRERNFILCFAGGDSYAFVHRTFLEYYCAEDLRLRFEQEQTLKLEDLKNEIYGPHWSDESWHEVLCLLAGALAPRFVTEILQYLLEQSDPEMSCQHIFLAARCIGEVRASVELGDVGVRVRNAVEGLLSVDLPHYYELWSSEAEFLEGIRMKAVHLRATSWPNRTSTKAWLRLRAHSDDKSEVRQAAVRELARGWRGDADTLGWLQGLAEFDDDGLVRQAAMQELVRGWKADANTLSILKACVRFDDHWSAKPAAMQELARGWAADPDAFAILNACIQPDQPSAVRQVAVRELVRGWKARPDTVVWLKNCVQSKDDSAVRETAVEELARGWKAVSDTQTILKELLRGNDDRRIRRAAVRELARGWKADPDTFAILRTWVQSSDDVVVREAAVEELAWGWKGDPDTFAILKTCAQSDGDKVVRRAALKGLGGGWKTDPETVVWLKACARSDNEWLIREAAVRELARGWTADPETLAILKVRAQSDAEADVRKAGVEELARGWNVDPDTLEILKVRAQSDDSELTPSDVFATASDSRASGIAVGMGTFLAGFATSEAAQQIARVHDVEPSKTWLTGANPRDSHAAMDGETVGIDDTFSNGLSWPGAAGGDAAEVANCNCSVLINL